MSFLFPYGAADAKALLDESRICAPHSSAEGRRVCAVQYKLRPFKNLREYTEDLELRYARAAAGGAQLIAFPELFGLTPLSALPLTRGLFRDRKPRSPQYVSDPSETELAALHVESAAGIPAKLFSSTLRDIADFSSTLLAGLSRKYHMMTADGSAPAFLDGRLYNVQSLFGADGELLGRQCKLNPMASELSLGVNYGESVNIFDTSLGRLALPVCMDASYYENFRIFRDLGAEIVVMGTCNMEEYDPWWALRGIRLRCSEYPFYGVKAAMTGCIAGNAITGHAEITGPCWQFPEGIIAASPAPIGNSEVIAELPPLRSSPQDHGNAEAPVLRELLRELYQV